MIIFYFWLDWLIINAFLISRIVVINVGSGMVGLGLVITVELTTHIAKVVLFIAEQFKLSV